MVDREVVLDQPVVVDERAEALRQATERAERAEAELSKLKQAPVHRPVNSDAALKTPATPSSRGDAEEVSQLVGEEELRKDSMMAHLLDSLDAGRDIGHYGRLVFAMVARHFMPHDEVLTKLMQDRDFSEEQARVLLRQLEGRDYNPPRRDRILAWHAQQEFPILPFPEDPDCGNLYRNLKVPQEIYEHIGNYQEAKLEAES
jgi:hypothetical protein